MQRDVERSTRDETAARKKRGNELKQALNMSPFVLEFEYGTSAEGYWTSYESMVLQLEDCTDVVKTIYLLLWSRLNAR
jgi:hypothetical protein